MRRASAAMVLWSPSRAVKKESMKLRWILAVGAVLGTASPLFTRPEPAIAQAKAPAAHQYVVTVSGMT